MLLRASKYVGDPFVLSRGHRRRGGGMGFLPSSIGGMHDIRSHIPIDQGRPRPMGFRRPRPVAGGSL